MNQTLQCDVAIIGGGAGGLSLAAGASQLGAKVILIESGTMGGDCLNYGCVPSKALLSAAKAFYHVQTAHYFGVQTASLSVDFEKVMQHVHQVITTISKNDSIERFTSLGVHVIKAQGQFINPKMLKAGDFEIQASRFVVATGSSPFIPNIPNLHHVAYYTNETIFNLKDQPTHLIVIGGGPIGCELAQAYAMLGSTVTLLEAFSILPKEDTDCVDIIRSQFESLSISIYEHTNIQHITQDEQGEITVTIEAHDVIQVILGSHLLVSAGRRANVDSLHLEKANITYSSKGIDVDARLRTSNKKIYAIGDVAGNFQFTHIANYQAGIVLRNLLFRWPAKVNYRAVPWVTYTEPEIAHVGLTHADVKNRTDIRVIESSFKDNDRAQTEHETMGKIKIIVDKKARVLAVTIVGSKAGELILPWVMAVRQKSSLRQFTDVIVPYPTLSEISKRVAGEFYTPKLFSNTTRWLVRQLLKLG